MATARKKRTKKKAKKKTAKKRTKKTKKRRSKFRRVAPKEYEIAWAEGYKSCYFGHRKGVGGEIGSGINDVIEVFSDGKLMYVLSMNFTECYACVEVFDGGDEVYSICFAEPKDMRRLMGARAMHECAPQEILETLAEAADLD